MTLISKKRGQESLSPLIYATIAIVVILLGIWGVSNIIKTSKQTNEADLIVFTNSLAKRLIPDSAYFGNVEEISFSLPQDVNEVCFIDKNRTFDEFINSELTISAKTFQDSTLFIKSYGTFKAFKVKNIKIEKENNPICIVPNKNKIDLVLENKGIFKDISSKNQKRNNDCTIIEYNGEPINKLDFVFIGSNYENLEDFIADTNKYYTRLKNSEPFESFYTKFNFYRVDDIKSLKCNSEELIKCDEVQINQLASQCPNDFVILLYKDNYYQNTRSSSVRNLVKIALNIDTVQKTVLMHELGHGIGNLADEYTEDDYYGKVHFNVKDYPNCDLMPCEKWGGVGCYEGCSMSQFFRPTQNSIMKSLSTNEFGPINEKIMSDKLEKYS